MFSYFAKDPYEVVGKSVHKRKYYVYVPLNRLFDRPQNISVSDPKGNISVSNPKGNISVSNPKGNVSPPGFNNNSFSNVSNLRFGSWDPRILHDIMINDNMINDTINDTINSPDNNSSNNIKSPNTINTPINIPFRVKDTNIPSPRGLPK